MDPVTPGPCPLDFDGADVEVSLVLAALKERWGYDFTGYAPAALRRRLSQLCAVYGVTRVVDLVAPIVYDENLARSVIRGMSVPVSEFFRDPLVWKFFRETITPQLESFPRINIWQAGCARGEETYSLAILLHETGLASRARLVATDINADLLASAREGRWSRRDFNQWRDNYLSGGGTREFQSYFREDGDHVVASDLVRGLVEFAQHNLVTDDVFLEAQLIVCRNVMIYFGAALQERGIDLFRRSLQRGGYLLLGQSESLLDVNGMLGAFQAVHHIFRIYRQPVGRVRCSA